MQFAAYYYRTVEIAKNGTGQVRTYADEHARGQKV